MVASPQAQNAPITWDDPNISFEREALADMAAILAHISREGFIEARSVTEHHNTPFFESSIGLIAAVKNYCQQHPQEVVAMRAELRMARAAQSASETKTLPIRMTVKERLQEKRRKLLQELSETESQLDAL